MTVELGIPEKARRDFEAALMIDPGFDQARRNLGNTSIAAPGR